MMLNNLSIISQIRFPLIFALSIFTLTSLAYADTVQVNMNAGTASNQNCGDQCFTPNVVYVKIGDTITWKNVDTAAHTATASDGSFDTSLISAGGSASSKFNTAGSYPYICILHPWMKGTVVVGQNTAPFVKTDRASYVAGDIVTLSGTGFSTSTTITISIVSSSNSSVEELTLSTTNTGTFQTLWIIPQQPTSNTYKITARDNTNSATTAISITESANTIAIKPQITTDPSPPQSTGITKLRIDFVNTQSGITQEHIDYTVKITKNGAPVFGPIPLVHTSTGIAAIPVEFKESGDYLVVVEIQGVLFRPIPAQTSIFTINVDQSSPPPTDIGYVKTSKSHYSEGEEIVISGDIGSILPNTPILIQIFRESGVVYLVQVEAAQDGTFTHSLVADGPYFHSDGEYVVHASYGVTGNTYETSFDFSTDDSTITDPIIVVTDEDRYSVGDTVSIYGEVSERLTGYDVTLELFAANGNLVTRQQLPVLDDNTFEIELIADGPLWRSAGTYTVKVLYGTATRTAETTFEFGGSGDVIPLPSTASVSIPAGSSTPGCEETNECYIESEVKIAVGGEVMWVNNDSASHTVTSGNPKNGPDGNFDSNLFLSGQTFSHRFDERGEFPYFCLVHPWMTGTVFVGQSVPNPNPVPTPPPDTNLPSDVTVIMAKGTASNQDCADRCYMPNTVSIAVGGKVTWNNVDSAAHTATAIDGSFDTSLVNAYATTSHTFRNVGTYPYMCILHPWMKGTVMVGQGVPNPNPTPDIELFVNVDKSEYDLGELATLNVQISDVFSPQNVAITVTDPFGTVMVSRTLTTDSNGNASTDFKIAESFKTGTYRIDATSSIDGWTYLDDSEFRVTSQFNQIQIVSAQGTDQQGNPMEFSRGSMGFVKVQVNAQKPIATLITVNVFDSDLTPLGVGSLKTTLNTGESELILSFMIPEDAVVGTADIYVNALSDWVSAGGIPQTGEFAGQVMIN